MRVLYFGTPEFAASILQDLVEAHIDIAAIVTKPDTPQGRMLKLNSPAVKKRAELLLPHVPILQPVKCSTPECIEVLKSYNADLFIVVAYGEILSQAVLDLPKLGCVNVHASLLPALRGAAPIQRALMRGDAETGISIIRLVKKMDAGNILHVEKMAIPLEMHAQELEEALAKLGTKALLQVIGDIKAGTLHEVVQDETKVTFADKITTDECRIDWTRPAKEVYNLIRAVSCHPGAWCDVSIRGQKKRLKILRAELLPHLKAPPGTLLQDHKLDCIVACHDGAVRLLALQLEGKPLMPAHDFMKGIPPNALQFLSP